MLSSFGLLQLSKISFYFTSSQAETNQNGQVSAMLAEQDLEVDRKLRTGVLFSLCQMLSNVTFYFDLHTCTSSKWAMWIRPVTKKSHC